MMGKPTPELIGPSSYLLEQIYKEILDEVDNVDEHIFDQLKEEVSQSILYNTRKLDDKIDDAEDLNKEDEFFCDKYLNPLSLSEELFDVYE